jgi:hypothetical protein
MPIEASEIKRVIEVEDDFGHEMRVGNILTNINYPTISYTGRQAQVLSPEHGGTYTDKVTGKTRQFDYRSQIVGGVVTPQRLYWAIECKNINPDYPFVICGRQRTTEESYHTLFKFVNHQFKVVRSNDFNSIYKPLEFVGKSVRRIKRKQNDLTAEGDSEIYDRWSQAISSCHDFAEKAFKDMGTSNCAVFMMPLVVVPNDTLWIANYKEDGLLADAPNKVDQCQFFIDQKISIASTASLVLTHIHFATLKGLSDMIADFISPRSRTWTSIFGI